MDANVTFRMDSQVKSEMTAICNQLGITKSVAFNIFANAFVRSKGMPFPVTLNTPPAALSRAQILKDTDGFLEEFKKDYERMAE
mgnify:FL=1